MCLNFKVKIIVNSYLNYFFQWYVRKQLKLVTNLHLKVNFMKFKLSIKHESTIILFNLFIAYLIFPSHIECYWFTRRLMVGFLKLKASKWYNIS